MGGEGPGCRERPVRTLAIAFEVSGSAAGSGSAGASGSLIRLFTRSTSQVSRASDLSYPGINTDHRDGDGVGACIQKKCFAFELSKRSM